MEDLTGANGAFKDVSFSVRAGEILGIAGIVGAGRTELVRGIAGADPLASGSVFIDGQRLQLRMRSKPGSSQSRKIAKPKELSWTIRSPSILRSAILTGWLTMAG